MVDPVTILDPEDPRIAGYRAIRERDLVGRQGLFVAEGEVVLRLLLASKRYRAQSVLIDEKRLTSLQPMLAEGPEGVPVFTASQAVLDAIAGFHLHRGILGLGAAAKVQEASQLLSQAPARALVLALIGISNHDNMGGLFRNAAALGADLVLLDDTCCDPLYRKAIRVSVGASLVTPWARAGSGADLLDLLGEHGFESLALSPAGEEGLTRLARPERCALVLGAEGPGLPTDILARARPVRIEMSGRMDSLNVATAAAIALHQLNFGTRA